MDSTFHRNGDVRRGEDARRDPEELTRRIAELEARIDELERERAEDVERLHTAHASLANTQLELLHATERAKVAEADATAPHEPRAPRAAQAPRPTRRLVRTDETPSALRAVSSPRTPVEPGPASLPPRPDVAPDASSAANGSVDDLLRSRIARFRDDLNAYRQAVAAPVAGVAPSPERRRRPDAAPEHRADLDVRRPRSRHDPNGPASGGPITDPEPTGGGDRLSLRQRLASAANARHQAALSGDRDHGGDGAERTAPAPPRT